VFTDCVSHRYVYQIMLKLLNNNFAWLIIGPDFWCGLRFDTKQSPDFGIGGWQVLSGNLVFAVVSLWLALPLPGIFRGLLCSSQLRLALFLVKIPVGIHFFLS
jgi:hypothetical protein